MIRRMKSQIRRRASGVEEPVFPPRTVKGVPVWLKDVERKLFEKVSSYCSQTARQAEGTDEADLVGFAMQIVKKRVLSSREALLQTIEHRLEALTKEEAREEAPSPSELRDYQADLPLTEAQSERTARRILRSAIPKDEKRCQSEVRALKNIRNLLKKLSGPDPKIEALVDELKRVFAEDPSEKVVVFTEYRDTLEAIRTRLDAHPELANRFFRLKGRLSEGRILTRDERVARATHAPEERKPKLLDQVRAAIRTRHYSFRTDCMSRSCSEPSERLQDRWALPSRSVATLFVILLRPTYWKTATTFARSSLGVAHRAPSLGGASTTSRPCESTIGRAARMRGTCTWRGRCSPGCSRRGSSSPVRPIMAGPFLHRLSSPSLLCVSSSRTSRWALMALSMWFSGSSRPRANSILWSSLNRPTGARHLLSPRSSGPSWAMTGSTDS